MRNLQVVLRRRPVGALEERDFLVRSGEVPVPRDGEVLVRTLMVSIDPAMRGWVLDVPNYLPPVGVGEPMRSFGIGRVEESHLAGYSRGDLVVGMTGWQEWAALRGEDIQRRVDPDIAPMSTALGVLGITGLTAYVGMVEIAQPAARSTVLVSSAAGAVGSLAGQLAAARGARVVGIAGTDEKCRRCVETYGFDAAINYRATADLTAAIRQACPDGVDTYFDSVGGNMLDAALATMNVGGRVVICGTISLPAGGTAVGPRIERSILVNRLRVEGFLATDHLARVGEITEGLAGMIESGSIRHAEELVDGLPEAPAALIRQLKGENTGKVIVVVP